MPQIKLPSGSGVWSLQSEEHGAQLWKRVMDKPDGETATFWVVGSENTPEIIYEKDRDQANLAYARFQLLAQ